MTIGSSLAPGLRPVTAAAFFLVARCARAFCHYPSSVRHRFGLPPSAFFEEAETMPNETTVLLHEKLIAWQVACELLRVVRNAGIRDPKLRDQAMRAAQSACLNIAEANGRVAPADRRRVFAIARGEATEAAAAVQIAAMSGQCAEQAANEARRLGGRAAALLSGLIR